MQNWLDRVISFVSPTTGAKRARARAVERVISTHTRSYDGAWSGTRTANWVTGSTSANTELQGGMIYLRNRARDLVRNDPFAARAVQGFTGNLVGHGISPVAKHKTASRSKIAQELWRQWGETTACDFHGHHDFYGLQAQAARCIFESGEVLIRRMRTRESAGLPVPLQLQILEPDYLDALRNNLTTPEGGYIMQGVEYDAYGKVVAYWLFKRHPGDIGLPLGGLVSERVPAAEVRHIYRVDRPGQNRGASWFAPILLKLRDFNEYEDAQLVRQKIAACFAVFLVDSESSVDIDGVAKNVLDESVEPGMVRNLGPGKDVRFGAPPGVEGYGDYSKNVLRGIAAGLNMPYEILTGDLSNVNFSSARMGWLEFHRNIEQWTWGMFIPQFCDPAWDWFIQAGMLIEPKLEGIGADWRPPRREMINPTEEIKAAVVAIRAGLMTRSDFIRSQGNEPDDLAAELASDNKTADKLGLILDSDPRKLSQVGIVQPPESSDPSSDTSSEGGK